MWAEAVCVPTNVARFPGGRREEPTLEPTLKETLEGMRELAPGVHEIIAALGLIDPAGYLADAAVAVADTNGDVSKGGENGAGPALAAPQARLAPIVAEALTACRSARDALAAAVNARQLLSRAQTSGERWRARAEALNLRWAQLLLEAHARVVDAEAVAQAAGM